MDEAPEPYDDAGCFTNGSYNVNDKDGLHCLKILQCFKQDIDEQSQKNNIFSCDVNPAP